MSKRYTGGVVSSAVPTVNAAGASGVFTLGQQASAQSNNNWPPFKVEKSLRFRAANSAYLTRTFPTAGNKTTWTLSVWVKRSVIATDTDILSPYYGGDSSNEAQIKINSNDCLHAYDAGGASGYFNYISTAVFRDPAAWYHIVVACDTTQATSGNRLKMYVNGTQITSFSTSQAANQNGITGYGLAQANYIGCYARATGSNNWDGQMAEYYFIDGQQLTPSSFGGTDKDGNWSPIAYTGTYGQNGYYLNFKDASSTSTLGYDYSGNGNNWSSSGISVTAGVTYDSMIDVPSDQSDGTANNRGNFATLNYADPFPGTMANGNLTHYIGSNDFASSRSTIGMKGGKWYWEAKCETTLGSSVYMGIGICSDSGYNAGGYPGQTNYGYAYDGRATKYSNGGSSSSYGASYTSGDIIGVAFDSDNGTLEYYKNGTSQGVAFTGIPTTETFYANHWVYTSQITYNFGQRPFAYAPPSGYKALNTYNLSEPTIKQPNKHFDATLYTGNGSTQSIVNAAGFKPDLMWIKGRSVSYSHRFVDSIRGATKLLYSDLTNTQSTDSSSITSINSNGFSLGGAAGTNENNATYVGWQWKAGEGTTSTNTNGSVNSTVSLNATAGFSVVQYVVPSSGTFTWGHGLPATPQFIIIKGGYTTNTYNWDVYHASLGPTVRLVLNSTSAQQTYSGPWNDTAPTATVVSQQNAWYATGDTNIAYCWTPIEGYSKFGKYTGNGSTNGPFIYCGFKPAYILLKKSSASGEDWVLMDNKRLGYNATDVALNPNAAYSENTGYATDFLSNGFKLRTTTTYANGSGATYVYAAFAENPFKYAKAR